MNENCLLICQSVMEFAVEYIHAADVYVKQAYYLSVSCFEKDVSTQNVPMLKLVFI